MPEAFNTSRELAWEVLAEEELTVTNSAVKQITVALLTDPVKTIARIQVQAQPLRYRYTTDPTTSVGMRGVANETIIIRGANDIRKLKMIAEATDAKVFVQLGRV